MKKTQIKQIRVADEFGTFVVGLSGTKLMLVSEASGMGPEITPQELYYLLHFGEVRLSLDDNQTVYLIEIIFGE